MNRFSCFLAFSVLAFLPLASAHSETIWWEAENATDMSMTTEGSYAPRPEDEDKISGGQWLNGRVADQGYAEYEVKVAEGGRYTFFSRRFWLHGVFRWRFDEEPWVTVEGTKGAVVVDQVPTARGPATWVDLGYVELKPGVHKLRVEMVAESTYQFNSVFAFDCFALSNDGFVPKGTDQNGGARKTTKTEPNADNGRFLGRTMALLESATPEHRTPVTILFYGQSIIQNSNIDLALLKYLREKYPNAVIATKNVAIGGYQAPILRRTAWQDLYPQNPDLLVFHDYGGEDGELEEIFQNIRKNLTADVLTWTHHVDNFGDGVDKQRDASADVTRTLGPKYGFEVADARALWKERLKETHEPRQNFLVDQIHLNPKGTALLAEALTPHFQDNPNAAQDWKKRVVEIPLSQPSPQVSHDPSGWTVSEGGLVSTGTSPLRLNFHGNRVDLVALPGKTGSARILLDGKAPSAERDTLAASRSTLAPGAWWPVVTQVSLAPSAVPETVTMNFHDVTPDGSQFAFDVRGSVSGDEGSGQAGQDYVARSGRYSIKAADLALDTVKKTTKKDLPAQFSVTWAVYSMSKDAWKPAVKSSPGFVAQDTVIRCWKDGPHVLEIVPTGDGPVGLKEAVVFSPGGQG